MREGLIVKKSLDFSILVVNYCESLECRKKFIIANQLLKSGTSIRANVFEAQHSKSSLDIIHKLKVALKEGNEIFY
jgi:four helix bundle protein